MAKLKIDITDLHKSFGSNEVLKGITTRFNEGDVVCIIGPSGSGKSTFLRTLNGLEEITSGTVIVDGYDLTNTKTNLNQVRQEVGMVFQQFNLFPNMTTRLPATTLRTPESFIRTPCSRNSCVG